MCQKSVQRCKSKNVVKKVVQSWKTFVRKLQKVEKIKVAKKFSKAFKSWQMK